MGGGGAWATLHLRGQVSQRVLRQVCSPLHHATDPAALPGHTLASRDLPPTPADCSPPFGCRGLGCGVRNVVPAGGRLQGASEVSEVTAARGQRDCAGHRFEKEKRFPENWSDFYVAGILGEMSEQSRREFSRDSNLRVLRQTPREAGNVGSPACRAPADRLPGRFAPRRRRRHLGSLRHRVPCALLSTSRRGPGSWACPRPACPCSPSLSQRAQLSFEARPLECSVSPPALTCSNRFAKLICKNSFGAFIF